MRKRHDDYDPPLDDGIREYVEALVDGGVETFESCEGGDGHAYAEPTVRFHGGHWACRRAFVVARRRRFPVAAMRQTWPVVRGNLTGPHWEIVFDGPPTRAAPRRRRRRTTRPPRRGRRAR